MLIGLDICDYCWSYMDSEFELEVRTSMQRLVSMSSYIRPNYLHSLRHSLFDSLFLMFFSKDLSNKVFILFLYSNCLLVGLNENIDITLLLMAAGVFLSKAINNR
ncbi:hypothetical protein Hanom_Chr13g01200151 [Helianthus anomalus]